MAESFATTNRFFDNKHYPRGFSRHGEFTIKEAQLLQHYGNAFNELDLAKRQPPTEEERLFIAVSYTHLDVYKRQVILLLKKLNFFSIMVTLLMSWTWQSVNPLRKKSVCLLLSLIHI